MTTEEDFQRALDACPEDWQTRLVFADFLDELDDPRGEGYRALGTLRRQPGGGDCPWFRRGLPGAKDNRNFPMDLPPDWFERIILRGKTGDFAPDYAKRKDATRFEVEDAAALAFSSLPAERRAELLSLSLTEQ